MSSLGKVTEAGTVLVSGVEYRVVEGVEMETHNPSEGTVAVRGAVNPYNSTIVLDRTLSTAQKELTLLHELVHAVDDALNVGLIEAQVGLVAAGLYSVEFKGPRKRDKVRAMRGVFYG